MELAANTAEIAERIKRDNNKKQVNRQSKRRFEHEQKLGGEFAVQAVRKEGKIA